MTRINCVPPEDLSYQHLNSEYRELPRVFNYVRKAQERGESPSDHYLGERYILGPGHVRFFYTRLRWCAKRQRLLVKELIKRGYNPRYRSVKPLLKGIDPCWLGDWKPNRKDMLLNKKRIEENTRLSKERKRAKAA